MDLDVHARSVLACALDGLAGEIIEQRLTLAYAGIARWARSLPEPVVVTYEAGPTGFAPGPARAR